MRRFVLSTLMASLAIVGISIVMPVQSQPQPASATQASHCPAGSYNIGTDQEPICKQEPTGCPYGDSISMDMCDKFAPQPEQPEVIQQPNPAPAAVSECGVK